MSERHRLGDLTLVMGVEPRGVTVAWHGRSTAREPEVVLAPYLGKALVRAMSLRLALVHDFTPLEFFNSSTISTLIRHLRDVELRQVPLHVRYARTQRWQRIFFDALDLARETRETGPTFRIEAVVA